MEYSSAERVSTARRELAAHRRDEAGELRDHEAEQRDKAGERRDHEAERRDSAADDRDRAANRRDQAGADRDRAADQRDEVGDQRDELADLRDRAADARDHAAERNEGWVRPALPADEISRSAIARREAAEDRNRAWEDRRAGAGERGKAEVDRSTALADRGAGAGERGEAGLDRDTALADRGAGAGERDDAEVDRDIAFADRSASANERKQSSVDGLTGVYVRGAGVVELGRDIARARRASQPLVLAFIDVDGLKTVNDSRGHAAGDRVLLEVSRTLEAHLRSYDLIIRYGGDEFVCALAGVTLAEATDRFTKVNTTLALGPEPAAVSVGLAELRAGDSVDDLVARADAALYLTRSRRQGVQRDIEDDGEGPVS